MKEVLNKVIDRINRFIGDFQINLLRPEDTIISRGLKAVLGQYELFTERNTRDHLVLTAGNGAPMHGVCMPHSISPAWEQQG